MKNNILITLIFTLCLIVKGQDIQQDKFVYSPKGINDFVITKVEGETVENIYIKANNWIKEKYKKPEKVIEMKIENEKIRINGIAKDLLVVKKYGFSLDYVIEISIKTGKYKFELVSLRTVESNTDYKEIPNFKTNKKMIKNFGNTPFRIEDYFNDLNTSLKQYILNLDVSDDDW